MTVYANLVDGELKGVYDLLPKNWNGILNFDLKARLDESIMKEYGFVKIVRDVTPFDSSVSKMSDFPRYNIVDGEVFEIRDIIPLEE